ncbi:Protein fmp52, mitochondrial [Fusarium torreyae]|uniref:Protein fmp52, mitochondrial n=1 Tax=Fusarium torreyae TaxID=1237075 RepID=A0A9W8S278_9HYPO|nr:Protein fmp52, mitochondrial [Fusarium torreyae]
MSSPSAAIIGSTGLVGSNILSTILAAEIYTPVHTITRRAPKATSSHLNAVVDTDTAKWADLLTGFTPKPSIVYSALGTTRAAAGGIANQWKIDHDLNIELAKASKAAGISTFVFISSAGTRSLLASQSPYAKMKNGVEDAIKELDFEQAIIVKPGMILGQRETSRTVEGIAQGAVNSLGRLSAGFRDTIGQDADVIAKAAVRAAQLAKEGKAPSKYWEIGGSDIIKLGRTEWPGNDAAAATEAKTEAAA